MRWDEMRHLEKMQVYSSFHEIATLIDEMMLGTEVFCLFCNHSDSDTDLKLEPVPHETNIWLFSACKKLIFDYFLQQYSRP